MSENAQNSEKNSVPEELKPYCFQPGRSGNPGGRPKKKPITEMFERMLANEQNAQDIEDAMLKVFVEKSGMAKVLLLEKMAERLEGKVTQPVDANVNVNLSLSDRMRRAEQRLRNSK